MNPFLDALRILYTISHSFLDTHVRTSVRDDPHFLRNVIGYSDEMFGGPSMWGSNGMLIVMAEMAAITRETQIYVPSHPAHATIWVEMYLMM
jgi:hypothetical protein